MKTNLKIQVAAACLVAALNANASERRLRDAGAIASENHVRAESSIAASLKLGADALLMVDVNRDAVIAQILESSAAQMSKAERDALSRSLFTLRADALLAASLTRSPERLLELAQGAAIAGGARVSDGLSDSAKALGELNRDLVYTPLAPCNLMDTRPGISPAPPEGGPKLQVGYVVRAVQVSGRCGIPAGAVAISAQFTAEDFPSLGGVIFAAEAGAVGGAVVVSWRNPATYASGGAVVPLSSSGAIQLQSANFTDLKLDINGYFMPPNRAGNGLRILQTTGARPDAPNIINGSVANTVSGQGAAVVSGGYSGSNCTNPATSATDYGCWNQATGDFTTVGGGFSNRATAFTATVMGGQSNTATGTSASIFGGQKNTAAGSNSVIVGGLLNKTSAAGTRAIVLGGQKNEANADSAFAGGTFALAAHDGAFVWADFDQANQFTSNLANEFAVRATGGVRFVTATTPVVSGVQLAAGSGTWTNLSDRSAKTAFSAINAKDVLSKVLALPITTWQYKAQDKTIRHIGPMSQDFRKAFGVGETDKGITTVDADGVALAAIQGLNQKLMTALKTKDAELAKLNAEMAAIKKKLGL